MIQKLWTFAKGLPCRAWFLVGLAVLYLFNVASGSIYTRKLWNMLHDQIVQMDKAIQEEFEREVTRLDQREKELIQENGRIKKQLAAAQEEKQMLLGGSMKSNLNSMPLLLIFPLLLTLTLWPRDSTSEDTALLCFPGSDAQRLLRIKDEAPLKDQKIALLEQRVSNLEKENDLLKQQTAIQEKLTELAKREAEVYGTAFEKEKELTDRALKLAEVGKPKSNWELQGLLGIVVFTFGLLVGR